VGAAPGTQGGDGASVSGADSARSRSATGLIEDCWPTKASLPRAETRAGRLVQLGSTAGISHHFAEEGPGSRHSFALIQLDKTLVSLGLATTIVHNGYAKFGT